MFGVSGTRPFACFVKTENPLRYNALGVFTARAFSVQGHRVSVIKEGFPNLISRFLVSHQIIIMHRQRLLRYRVGATIFQSCEMQQSTCLLMQAFPQDSCILWFHHVGSPCGL